MRSINIESDKGNFEGVLKVLVYNLDHLEFLIHKLKKVKGVTSVAVVKNKFFKKTLK